MIDSSEHPFLFLRLEVRSGYRGYQVEVMDGSWLYVDEICLVMVDGCAWYWGIS